MAGRPTPKPPNTPLWPIPLNNGGLAAAAVRTLIVPVKLGLAALTTDVELFSPNADGIVDVVNIRGEALEAATLTVRVRLRGSSSLVRTIVSDLPTSVGFFDLVWDGRNDSGLVVEDGEYFVEVEAVNGCGALSTASVLVEIDNTVPTVAIANLVDDQPISVAVEIIGTATDEHFDNYVLEFGEGASPLIFTPIMPPGIVTRQVDNKLLGNWSVGDLAAGIYTLRLSAVDVVGNRATAPVRLQVLAAEFIERYAVDPALISPNGDAVKDQAEIELDLKAEARVTLTILSSASAPVTTLIDGVVLPIGPHTAIWDGLGVADGDYVAFLRAEHPTASTLFEEAEIAITVDTVAPAVTISTPAADGFLSLPGVINGSITDDHLEHFEIEVGPTAGALRRVAEDTLSASGVLATLSSLGDGTYRLRATASDQAGNTTELDFMFEIDSTPPALALTAPIDGAFVARLPGGVPLPVMGSVEDANLERYDLEVGFGAPPSVFVPLAGGTSAPTAPTLATWDLETLPDGHYTLRLSATDQAANFRIVETAVILDTTPPTVVIETPAPDAVVSVAIGVGGTVNDDNFAAGTLGVAPAATPDRVTQLASFTSPVTSGVLVESLALVDGNYILELRAEDLAGNVATTTTAFRIDTEPPLAPSGLTANTEARDVTLAWTASPSNDVVGYHLSRDGVRITVEPVPATSFVDTDLDEGVYRYTVVAVDAAKLESEPTDPATARIDLTPPNVVLRSPDEGDRVRIDVDVIGTAFSESDFFEYRLSAAPVETPQSPTLVKRSSVPVSFDTLGRWRPLTDGDYILTLEGEDTSGNVAEDSVRVTVDNAAPRAPVLVRAEALAKPDDVEIEWTGPSDTDVDGFLVFRNGQIANAPGMVSGSLRPFLVPGPTYVDAELPDGEHCYRVAAMDIAGNISADSNELCVFLDNREPAAVIFDPEDGARFDAARTIRAASPDLDIATVSFQYQPVEDTVWTVIAVDTDGEPFETIWDIADIDFGDYLLRAVATDIGTRSDPAPATIGVTLGDVTPPGAPSDLSARVVGDTVELDWIGVTASDLAGYRIFRDDTMVLEPGAAAVSAVDADVPDGDYDYTVRAVDADGNESDPSNTAAVRVYAPSLVPAFPVFETTNVDLPGTGVEPGATVRLFDAGTTDEVGATTADARSGGFLYSALSLLLGSNLLEAEATDADTNVSRRSNETLLIRNDVPAQPTGFVAVASGDDANLSWDPNGEADLSGYLIARDGDVVNTRGLLRPSGLIPTDVTVAASVNASRAASVIGPGLWGILVSDEEQWIELTLAEPRHLDQVRLLWTSNRAAKDYDLLIELEGRLAPIVRVRDQAPTSLSEHTLPIPVQTTRVRLHIFSGATPFVILLDEFELIGVLPEKTTAFTDRPSAPGVYDYAVEAIDTLGGRSLEAGPIALGVGDLTPPAAPTLTATVDEEDVLLSWPAIADAVLYRIFRDDVQLRETSSTFVTDNNLLNGTYAYHVIAIDAAENESGRSNVEIVTVDVAPPSAPVISVTPLAIGHALSLSWTESIGPLGVSSYVISRSTTTGGPYLEIASVGGSTFAYLDSGLEGGVEYFYVVHAVDLRGEASDLSNEASGIPTDTVPPRAPFWISPESPLTVTASRIDLVGAAEPATTVEVFRDGASIGTTPVSDEFRLVAEPFLRRTSNISGRFALSHDRSVVAEVSSSFTTNEVRLYDLRTGAVRTVPYQEDGSFERGVSFSPNGRYIAVATTGGSPVNRAIRILDLETETTEVLALADPPQAPAFVNDDELAVVVGDDIRIFDLALDTERTIYTSTSSFTPENLAASTDGAYLAWNESDALYVMPVTGGAPELVFDDFLLEDFEWAGARTLVFEAFDLGLHFYDVEMLSTVLIPNTEDLRFPTSLGTEGAVSAYDGRVLYWVFADTTVMELGEPSADFNQQFFAWSQDLLLAGTTFGRTLAVVETPGRFGLEARLEPDLNVLIARATDEEGNVSPDADALELTYDNSSLADLTFDGEITIVPSVPSTGDSASISIPIVNAGASPSPESSVSVTGAELSGTLYTVGAATIPVLDAGARTIVVLSWSTADRLGPQSIQAVIDPLQLLDEADETNNTAGVSTTVVGTAGLELTITTGRPSYAAGQLAELTVSAVNGGRAFDGVLEIRIEDTNGALVALVDSRPSSLTYARSTRYSSFWTTGSIAAGSYVARVTALSVSDVVATATASFELTRTLDITLDVIPERPFYEQGDLVRLLARVANVGSNAPLRDLSLRYRIVDPNAVTVFDATVPLGYLAIGGALSSSSAWTSGADELGTYSVSVDAFEGVELVASKAATFDMTAASTITLTGALNLAAEAVPAGSEVMVSYTIDNESVIELTSGTVRVELFDAAAVTTVASADAPLTLAGGDTVSGELRIATAGLELGRYSVVLSAGGTRLRSLAAVPVTLFATPAAPSLNAPANGASAPQRLLLSVNNATNPNDETLTYEFEIYLDPSLTVRLGAASGLPEGATTTAWSVLTFLEENRHYYWRARAQDRFAKSDWMVPATVFVDSGNEAPDAPVLSAPADTTEVDVLRPTLVVGNATDPENDVLTYTFELYLDEGLTDLALATSGIPETSATTSFTPTVDLIEDATYFWRARANDGDDELNGEWMTTATFRVNTANHAPNAPTPVEPVGGSVATLTPELVVISAIDPEGDPITHTFQIDVSDSFDSPARQESLPLSGDDVRWTPPAPLDENIVYFWRARAADPVASGPWSTVASFRVDVVNEPPEAPTPQRPADGAVVESATPVLAVVNALDPENDPRTYTFEVYEEDLIILVASVTALPEGVTETAWAVSPRLVEETTYFWIARANDGNADGPASAPQRFRVNVMNEEPTAPVLLSPAEGAIVSELAPTLVVSNATDPDEDPLTYLFEVYEDELLKVLVERSGEIGEGADETSLTMSAPLVENHLYYWRVRAFDTRLEGAWMATARFRFSLANEPPTNPIALEPQDLAVVAENQPTLVIAPSTDPEQDALTYTYHVFRDAALTLTDLVVSSPATDETSWLVSLPLDENQTFYWHAIASDGDLESAPSVAFSFTVNAVDEPPTAPVLSSPADGAIITTTTPTLTVENATSPDGLVGEPLVYHFALYADAALTDVVAEDVAVAEGAGTTSWDPPVTLTPGARYYWSARAIDARGRPSKFAPAFSFTVEPPVRECPPEWRDDFERYPRFTRPWGWQLQKEFLFPSFHVRVVKGSKRLASSILGRGSLLFAGNGEAFDWRNYQLEGELHQKGIGGLGKKLHKKSACLFTTGVVFYANPTDRTAYRLELTGPYCKSPKARIVKVSGHHHDELARIDLDRNHQQNALRFHIEAVNGVAGTMIHVRLNGRVHGKEREWTLAVEDTDEPFRSGNIGAWGNFVKAAWDDFHVREILGLSSGISGDADGDDVCDVDFDTGSRASVQFHRVEKKTKRLSAHNPAAEPATYRLRPVAHHHGPLSAELPDGAVAEIRTWFGFSKPIEFTLPPGTHEIRLSRNLDVEAYRLEHISSGAPR